VIFILLSSVIGYVVWKKWFRKTAVSVIRTQHGQFRTRGNQVKPTDLLDEVVNLDREALERKGGWLEFYPNQKIVVLVLPPVTQIYCYCNLMQYMDLTRAIEKKIFYGVNPPRFDSVQQAA